MKNDRSAAFAAEVHPLLSDLAGIGIGTDTGDGSITLTLLGYAVARWPDLTVEEFSRALQIMAEVGKMDGCNT